MSRAAKSEVPSFPYPGGKASLSSEIIKYIPQKGRKFIDVFGGRGNIILRAIHEGFDYEQWVVNDILTAPFFRAIKSHGDTFVTGEKVQKEYDRCAESKRQGDAYALLMEPWLCYNGGTYEANGMRGLGGGKRSPKSHTQHVRMAHKLLCEKNVKVTALDWLDCLKVEELTSDDFVIVDMPYIGSDAGAYSAESVCPTEVIEHLQNAPFHWAFCEYDQPLYFATLGEPVFKKEVQLRACMLAHIREKRTECLWVGGSKKANFVTVTKLPSVNYGCLSEAQLLEEIRRCAEGVSVRRNQMSREMRDRLLPALLELKKRTKYKRPGFYETLEKIGLNADTVRQWFYRSHAADEVIALFEEDEPEPSKLQRRDERSPEELLLEHADRMAKAILADKFTHAKKIATEYLRTRDENRICQLLPQAEIQ